MTEVGAPDGHTIEPNPVTIDEDGETVVVFITNPQVRGDEPTARIAIQKLETGPSAPNGTHTFRIRGPVVHSWPPTWCARCVEPPLGISDAVTADTRHRRR